MRVRKSAFAALAVTAALSLTACQDDGAGTAQGAPATAPTTSTGASPSGGPASGGPASGGPGKGSTPPTAAPAGSTGAGKGAKCRTADLTITAADRTITGDADNTVVVELKNHSGKDCTLSGYAGVDLKTSAGTLSAKRSGEPVVAGVVTNGKSTYFGISYPANTSGGSGVKITGLVVTPPDETQSVTLPWPGTGSLPVTDAGGSPVKIGPMGSAGQGQ
ncbi:DUF4232 domain-containing protein [Streptomyces sp. CB01881]|uniref:DUF4232 domain-containing protein n=1 Tax=Streptomyces sp. CB01881 TaxID=2078691 RepID=UPI000CDBB5EB|nr:DUF4232 domain-containing protein [Streptomyces sp. CB01881]AUY53719.1 hypothetical protein C2142_38370 [Streptomyces sp. CB01881]TYC68729.1 DUF4232 domain-containing protein [Streptomyces sp. CB01881]